MLETPGNGDGRPEILHQSLVRVDRRSDERHNVWKSIDEPGKEVATDVREVLDVGPFRVIVPLMSVEEIVSAWIYKRYMHMS